MDAPSVDDPALKPPGQAARAAARSSNGLDCLGEIEIGGEPALVVWPQLGDAVALDFKRDGHRYALAAGLDSGAPRLKVEPVIGRQVGADSEPAVLAEVVAIWAERRTGA